MKYAFAAAAAATAAVALAAPASAQSISQPAFYGNLGYTFIDGNSAGDLGVLAGRVGARLHPNFGAEAELGFGVDSAKAGAVKTKVRHTAAAYAVGFLPVTEQFDLFARGGYGTTRLKVSVPGASASGNQDSWNYGVGGQYSFDGKNGVRGEYTRYDFTGNGNGGADTWSVSYVRKF